MNQNNNKTKIESNLSSSYEKTDNYAKKYQVFISSTYKDLKTARKYVSDAILSMGHFPVGMEMFGARDEEQWIVIQETIDQSDYYIVIVGKCFGSEVPGEGISYTQKEFRYALEKGIPVLCFIAAEDAEIAASHQDSDLDKIAKLNTFKQELETGRTVDYWINYDNLALKVALSLPKQIRSHPMPGWIRVDEKPKVEVEKITNKVTNTNYHEIKQKLEDRLINYKIIRTIDQRRELTKKPWLKFKVNNIILQDDSIKNPTYENGLIKAEPYGFYDDGILVFSSRGDTTVILITKAGEKTIKSEIDIYIVEAIPFSRIHYFDEEGSINEPYPTLYCRFENGTPFEEEWYIDKETGIRYTKDQIVESNQ